MNIAVNKAKTKLKKNTAANSYKYKLKYCSK
jgi:hypothetical protein